MTLFEYLSVGYSIVLSLTVVRLLGGLSAAVVIGRRYWIHIFWIGFVLIRSLLFWWSFWSNHDVESWNFFSFSLVLLAPGILFVMASMLIPDDAGSILSWRVHFYAIHRRFFITMALSLLIVVAQSHVLLDVPLLHPLRAFQASFFVFSLIGAATKSARFHAFLVVTSPLVLLPVIVFFYLEPSQLVSAP